MDANDVEMRATELAYEHATGRVAAYAEIPDEDRSRILAEVRERAERIERFVLHDMLTKKTSEGRFTPRRFALPALATFVIMAAVVGVGYLILKLLRLA